MRGKLLEALGLTASSSTPNAQYIGDGYIGGKLDIPSQYLESGILGAHSRYLVNTFTS
jgi:hypothetical protein